MEATLNIARQTRKNVLTLLDSLTLEELNTVPQGFNNNILWNAGHIALVHVLLTYGLSGNTIYTPSDWREKFGKDSKGSNYSQDDLDTIKKVIAESIDKIENDYEAGLFTAFKTYETSYGYTLHSVEESIEFNNIHDGVHYGYMLAQRKALKH